VALRLRRERMPWADTLAHTVMAAAENAAGDRAATLGALRAHLTSAAETEMAMHACAARHRLGELLGGDEGRALVESARETLTSEGIRKQAAWLAVFLPGRWAA
jgi:eukaryotic-like serine/threonine-protein kinase